MKLNLPLTIAARHEKILHCKGVDLLFVEVPTQAIHTLHVKDGEEENERFLFVNVPYPKISLESERLNEDQIQPNVPDVSE